MGVFFRGLCFALCLSGIGYANAQPATTGGLRIIVGYPPGGGTDTVTRHIAAGLADVLGYAVVVENRPGASGLIGGEAVSRAAPDGRTLMTMESAFTVNPSLRKTWTLDPTRDFTQVSLMGTAPLILVVHPAIPAKTLAELLAYAKANPGKLTYGTAGTGNMTHLSPELMKFKAGGLDIVHVPYKGSGPAVTDLLGGRISLMFTGISAVQGHVNEGKLRAIAITGTSRSLVLPQVPTLAEAGLPVPELDLGTWWGLVAPPNMPRDLVTQLNLAIRKVTENPAVREKLASVNIRAVSNTPEEFTKLVRDEVVTYTALVKRGNITVGE